MEQIISLRRTLPPQVQGNDYQDIRIVDFDVEGSKRRSDPLKMALKGQAKMISKIEVRHAVSIGVCITSVPFRACLPAAASSCIACCSLFPAVVLLRLRRLLQWA